MNIESLAEFFAANFRQAPQNAVITPFLPLRTFSPKPGFFKEFNSGEASAGLSEKLSVIRSGIGGKNVFEAVNALKGTRCSNIVFVGSCGGIGAVNIGDMILPDPKASFGAAGLYSGLGSFLERTGVRFTRGRIYSVESVKDETPELMDNLEKSGFSGVDLEVNIFFRAAFSCALNAGALLYVTDIPLKRPFTERFTETERKAISSARETAVSAVLNFLEELA